MLALVAARLGAARVLGTDVVPAAVRLAGLNARRLGLEGRAEFSADHLLDPLPDASVDVVVGDVSGTELGLRRQGAGHRRRPAPRPAPSRPHRRL